MEYIHGIKIRQIVLILFLTLLLLSAIPVAADSESFQTDTDFAQVEKIRMVYRSNGHWDVYVTVRHNDQGWDHYADRWQVIDEKTGDVLVERILAHPHDNEQPFTRSLSGLVIPEGIRNLRIRSSCPQHGYGGREISIELPTGSIENGYTVNM